MLGLIIALVVIGLIAGAIARLIVPGRQAIGIGGTILVGMVGSFVGGFLGYVLFHHNASEGALRPSGIIGSIIGAVIVLLIWQHFSGRGRMSRTW
ncbi:MAG TPA: GlsB/YeaQ/YmgE family stress response membrane protein [Jatrophihabitantaceae bacterium]|nr:GlsB/YeaQ/YmgE family stress response membrane protein [Jatrophihabitantaceae bacterium]